MDIKVGDTLIWGAVTNKNFRGKIVRATKTQWVVETDSDKSTIRFRKRNLRGVGSGAYWARFITEEKLKEEIETTAAAYRTLAKFRGLTEKTSQLERDSSSGLGGAWFGSSSKMWDLPKIEELEKDLDSINKIIEKWTVKV